MIGKNRGRKTKILLIFALGFEFIGLILGGSFAGHLIGKFLGWQSGVGEAVGTLVGLAIGIIATYRILKILMKAKEKD
ncbi:MAG: hypothetical protein NZ927_02660 [Candidatus Calescibacterium sp.]|nr:hypothetical protein [Candidatus Calescibacterium sp.]MCX7734028.1 hypothetical protein [bacterium]MDW8086372.1 hypothetical protein [Candidatus Calescibacterium sp.]